MGHGKGTMFYWDGNYIESEYVDGKVTGPFKHYYANGDWIEGDEQSLMLSEFSYLTGTGKKFYTDGSRYEGQFLNGKRWGKGTQYSPDGKVYEGIWKNDKMESPTSVKEQLLFIITMIK